MTQKSPEQIMEELRKSYPGELRHYGFGRDIKKELQDFFRSSLASVLLWAAEEMPKEQEYVFDGEDEDSLEIEENCDIYETRGEANIEGMNDGYEACRSLLIEKAKELLRDTINEAMQEIITEDSIRKAAIESAEDQAEMVRKAKEITKE